MPASVWLNRLLCIFVLLCTSMPATSGEGEVALVAARGSGVEEMLLRDIRRLYLGLNISESGTVGSPVLNHQSEDIYDQFMKNVMHMTASSYKRKVVKSIFRRGRQDISETRSLVELNRHLLQNRGDVSFVELSAVKKMNDIEVVQILW